MSYRSWVQKYYLTYAPGGTFVGFFFFSFNLLRKMKRKGHGDSSVHTELALIEGESYSKPK